MGNFVALTGRRFSKLTVIKRGDDYVSPKGYHSAAWLCRCDCGTESVVRGVYLKNGKTKSCGCLRVEEPNRTTHGQSKTRLYKIWRSMRARCEREKDRNFENYGGRGVTVCDDWTQFENFMDWAYLHGYDESLSIDRIDNNGNYDPSNCRWVDMNVQANNTRHNHYITYKGATKTMSQWAKETGIGYHKLKDRINKCGWDIERALTENKVIATLNIFVF